MEKVSRTRNEQQAPTKWRQWFQGLNDDERDDVKVDVEQATTYWNDIAKSVALSPQEEELIGTCDTPDKLQSYSQQLILKHKARRRQEVQRYVHSFAQIADQYSSVVDALSEVIPYGLGRAVWGAFSVLITVVVNKGRLESQFELALNHLRAALPRIEVYRDLYPTERMYRYIAEVHREIAKFVQETITYYKRLDWKGSLKRFFDSAGGYQAKISDSLLRIDKASKDVTDEGIVGLSAEVREMRGIVVGTAATVKRITEQQSLERLRALKVKLVPTEYDSETALDQNLKQSRRPRTGPQADCCRLLLRGQVGQWLTSTACRTSDFPELQNNPAHAKLLFLHSSDYNDRSVSYIAQDVMETTREEGRLLLHSSLFNLATSADHFNSNVEKSPKSVLREAIYQALVSKTAVLEVDAIYSAVHKLNDKSSFNELMHCLENILLQAHAESAVRSGKQRDSDIVWVIDRIDDLFPCREPRLGSFVRAIQELIVQCQGKLRVLIISLCAPSNLDTQWTPDEVWKIDIEEDEHETQEIKSSYCEVVYRVQSRRSDRN